MSHPARGSSAGGIASRAEWSYDARYCDVQSAEVSGALGEAGPASLPARRRAPRDFLFPSGFFPVAPLWKDCRHAHLYDAHSLPALSGRGPCPCLALREPIGRGGRVEADRLAEMWGA